MASTTFPIKAAPQASSNKTSALSSHVALAPAAPPPSRDTVVIAMPPLSYQAVPAAQQPALPTPVSPKDTSVQRAASSSVPTVPADVTARHADALSLSQGIPTYATGQMIDALNTYDPKARALVDAGALKLHETLGMNEFQAHAALAAILLSSRLPKSVAMAIVAHPVEALALATVVLGSSAAFIGYEVVASAAAAHGTESAAGNTFGHLLEARSAAGVSAILISIITAFFNTVGNTVSVTGLPGAPASVGAYVNGTIISGLQGVNTTDAQRAILHNISNTLRDLCPANRPGLTQLCWDAAAKAGSALADFAADPTRIIADLLPTVSPATTTTSTPTAGGEAPWYADQGKLAGLIIGVIAAAALLLWITCHCCKKRHARAGGAGAGAGAGARGITHTDGNGFMVTQL